MHESGIAKQWNDNAAWTSNIALRQFERLSDDSLRGLSLSGNIVVVFMFKL